MSVVKFSFVVSMISSKNELEKALPPEIEELHRKAVENNEETYIDPVTGLTVFTRLAHLKKKECCGSYCRHCPYNHCNVAKREKCNTVPKECTGRKDERTPKANESAKKSDVYTKGGDKGTSALFTGERRPKTDVVFEALGTLDELSSHAGLARSFLLQGKDEKACPQDLADTLKGIQQELLNASTVVATPAAGKDENSSPLIKLLHTYDFPSKTAELEKLIDEIDSRLEKLRLFILPGGGTLASAQLHVCRTACRRAERRMIEVQDRYGEQYTEHLRQAAVYVNRLSDFFFVAARSVAEEDIVRQY